jgi:ornithine cyclodeaminase/alanine dehydrogenase-like protein (mu-crystallin family)
MAYRRIVRTMSSQEAAGTVLAMTARLVNSEVITAAVLGGGLLAEAHLELMPRVAVSHVTLFDDDEAVAYASWDRRVESLRRQGVGFSLAGSAHAAVAGANLVLVLAEAAAQTLRYGWLARGSVLVNYTPQALDRGVVRRAKLILTGSQLPAIASGERYRRIRRDDLIVVDFSTGWPLDGIPIPGR